MLTDTTLRSAVETLWDKLWSGGLANPLDAIEQLSFLLFLKRLDEREQDAERAATLRGKTFTPVFPDPKLRWSYWTQLRADEALKHVREHVFPFLKTLGGAGGSFAAQMENAEFKINKPSLLIEACRAIDAMQISAQNQDVQGDLYEYLLGKLNIAGQNGQFRTPRHIIRMMVQMRDPRPGERICDPAAGTCGFLVNAWQHLLESHTDPRDISYDEEGYPHGLTGSRLTKDEYEFSETKALTGYDSDSGMTMLRIGSMNLMLHGIAAPNFRYTDALSKAFTEERAYDVVLANPPFKGAIDSADVNPTLPVRCKKTEILFLHLFLRLLENGGRAAVIVPDGVLFGSSNAHVDVRRKIIEENRLDGVVSMPSGVFRPYAGVSTAVLLFTKGGRTENIWFYDMEHDGYSLDDKRQNVAENDIPDVLDCWIHRRDAKFHQKRAQRLAELQGRIVPLKKDRLEHHAIIHRLKFEEVVSKAADKARVARDKAEAELAELQSRVTPLQTEINQLTRQFWVTRDQVQANTYDLSASRYRQVEQDDEFYAEPRHTLERLRRLEVTATRDVATLERMLAKS
ncbi:MAG TPA: class I SAM-dependent DNA methyltransferase [Vicinamibacterales bacterium]|nr:class I SAM-dependent DNA methyltransferase [Vicinamibacterales bacterium]